MSHAGEAWVEICGVTDIPVRGARIVKSPVGCIAVFRTVDDAVFAVDDKCPHKGGPLSQGIVHGRTVTCPLHNWVISLETGEAQGADEGAAATHKVRVAAGRVQLLVSASGSCAA